MIVWYRNGEQPTKREQRKSSMAIFQPTIRHSLNIAKNNPYLPPVISLSTIPSDKILSTHTQLHLIKMKKKEGKTKGGTKRYEVHMQSDTICKRFLVSLLLRDMDTKNKKNKQNNTNASENANANELKQ